MYETSVAVIGHYAIIWLKGLGKMTKKTAASLPDPSNVFDIAVWTQSGFESK